MMVNNFSTTWEAMALAAGHHLWQSTLFAVITGILTLLLRSNHAKSRYWLWLAASLKFLVPFSLLVGIGSHLPWARVSTPTRSGVYFAIQDVLLPPGHPTLPLALAAGRGVTLHANWPPLLPEILGAAWFCGFASVLFLWCMRWRRISLMIREATPLTEGREVEALRNLERTGVMGRPLSMRLSRSSFEPGIFGILRPVLVWPEKISDRLSTAQLEAVLAHELGHVRRRDNLTAFVHMIVEAIFWFHPLVWWLGTRLVEERERACDEEVLAMESERSVYAESILKVSEFCVESRLACVSGVTGADLKKRIVRIMTMRALHKLGVEKRLLLGTAGLLAVVLPIVFGSLHATPAEARSAVQSAVTATHVYDVASIKPNKSDNNMIRLMYSPDGLSASNVALEMLVGSAFGVEPNQIQMPGAPGWVNSDKFDIEAKMESSVAEELRKLKDDERRTARQQMLQALLRDRFKFAFHRETKDLPIYALTIAKSGLKMQEAKPGDTYPNGLKGPDGVARAGFMRMGRGELTGQGLQVSALARLLTNQLGRTVVDKTGLTAKYDFTLKWTSDDSEGGMLRGPAGGPPQSDSAPSADSSAPSLFTAVQEQLGLKLESQKGPVEIIVIDHVEKPSEN